MNKSGTHLSLTPFDDRIVPSATFANPGQSGVVNAIYVDDGSTDTGINIGNSPISGANDGVLSTDYTSVPSPKVPSGTYTLPENFRPEPIIAPKPVLPLPKPIPIGPLPQYAGPDGVKQPPRELTNQEVVKAAQLQVAINDLEVALTVWQNSRISLYMVREELLMQKPLDREALETNRQEIDKAGEEVYMLQRKINELQSAIDVINESAKQGYPKNSKLPPPDVEKKDKIGTADGKFVDIKTVLQEMYPVDDSYKNPYPLRPELFS